MASRTISCLIALIVVSVAQVEAREIHDGATNRAPGGAARTVQAPTAHAPVAKHSTKCRTSDTECIKNANAPRKKVEIVEKRERDMLRCSSKDADCLRRALATGGKVDITD